MVWCVQVHGYVFSIPIRYIHEVAADPQGGTPKAQKLKEAGGLARCSERERTVTVSGMEVMVWMKRFG